MDDETEAPLDELEAEDEPDETDLGDAQSGGTRVARSGISHPGI